MKVVPIKAERRTARGRNQLTHIRKEGWMPAVVYGAGGALIAAVLIAGTLWLLAAPVDALAALYASDFSLSGLSAEDLSGLAGGGAVLGWAGAWLAAARHLRAIEPS